ncbi:MAG: hypothetical protein QXD98_01700 [Candidatus Diapherotrites archaeon]
MKNRLLTKRQVKRVFESNNDERQRTLRLRALRNFRLRQKYRENFVKPARLLFIADEDKRKESLKRGKMAFTLGKKQIELELKIGDKRLVMPFKFKGKIYIARFNSEYQRIGIFELTEKGEQEIKPYNFISCEPRDMSHLIMSNFEKSHIIIPLLRIAAQHAVAVSEKAQAAVFLRKFLDLFIRAGYKVKSKKEMNPLTFINIINNASKIRQANGNYEKAGILKEIYTLEYEGKKDERNDLNKNFRIVAYDPSTAKINSYYFS